MFEAHEAMRKLIREESAQITDAHQRITHDLYMITSRLGTISGLCLIPNIPMDVAAARRFVVFACVDAWISDIRECVLDRALCFCGQAAQLWTALSGALDAIKLTASPSAKVGTLFHVLLFAACTLERLLHCVAHGHVDDVWAATADLMNPPLPRMDGALERLVPALLENIEWGRAALASTR